MASKRLALNTDGQMTYCSAPEDKIGVGRCNHSEHQKDGESAEDFVKRANSTFSTDSEEEPKSKPKDIEQLLKNSQDSPAAWSSWSDPKHWDESLSDEDKEGVIGAVRLGESYGLEPEYIHAWDKTVKFKDGIRLEYVKPDLFSYQDADDYIDGKYSMHMSLVDKVPENYPDDPYTNAFANKEGYYKVSPSTNMKLPNDTQIKFMNKLGGIKVDVESHYITVAKDGEKATKENLQKAIEDIREFKTPDPAIEEIRKKYPQNDSYRMGAKTIDGIVEEAEKNNLKIEVVGNKFSGLSYSLDKPKSEDNLDKDYYKNVSKDFKKSSIETSSFIKNAKEEEIISIIDGYDGYAVGEDDYPPAKHPVYKKFSSDFKESTLFYAETKEGHGGDAMVGANSYEISEHARAKGLTPHDFSIDGDYRGVQSKEDIDSIFSDKQK